MSLFRLFLRLYSREFELATLRLKEIALRFFFRFGAEMTFARFEFVGDRRGDGEVAYDGEGGDCFPVFGEIKFRFLLAADGARRQRAACDG